MPRKIRALLAQLPNYSLPFAWPRENVPLAAGYLLAAARKAGLPGIEVELLDPALADTLGDAALVDAIDERAPDVLGFTLYCWNVERCLNIARRLKERRPGLIVVVGGPEVTADNAWILAAPASADGPPESRAFDAGVLGEGERSCLDLLLAARQGRALEDVPGLVLYREGALRLTARREPILDLDEVPSPYLEGLLSPDRAGFICFETIRGCVYRCAFCYYYKDYEQTQGYSAGRIRELLEFAKSRSVREVFLLDPTLNQRRDFTGFLRLLAEGNCGRGIALNSELRAEFIQEEQAALLAECGMRGVEVGLQSINTRTLKEVHRGTNLERFTRGVRLLEGAGLRVRLDLILGLPGDTLADVREAAAWVLDRGFACELQIFGLQALPGTELKLRAAELGMVHDPLPPYTVRSTRGMDPEALREAHEHCNEAFGVCFDPDRPPILTEPRAGSGARNDAAQYHSRAILDLPAEAPRGASALKLREQGERFARAAANAITVAVRTRDLGADLPMVEAFLEPVVRENPYAPLDIVVEPRGPKPVRREDLARLLGRFGREDHYLNRFRRESVDHGILTSARVSVAAEEAQADAAWLRDLEAVAPVYRERGLDGSESPEELSRLAGEGGLIPRPKPDADPARLLAALSAWADGDPGSACWREPALQAAWDEALGDNAGAAADDRAITS